MRGSKTQGLRRGARLVAVGLASLLVALAVALLPVGALAATGSGTGAATATGSGTGATAVAGSATTPQAGQRVDTAAACSITLEDCKVPGQEVVAWRVASMAADGRLQAVDALKAGIEFSGMDPALLSADTDAQTLRDFAEAYAGLVAEGADGFERTTAQVAADGTARLAGLKPGLYLLTMDTVTANGVTYVSSPYLVSVPALNAEGVWMYDRTVKADKVTTTQAPKFHNRLQKLWSGDTASTRPTSVTMRIYDGTTLYQTVELNAQNDWSYEWDGEGDWSVVEDAASASGYTFSVVTNEEDLDASGAAATAASAAQTHQTTLTVTNKTTTPPGDTPPAGPPHTGDNTDYTLPAVLVAAGVVLVALGVARGRKSSDDRRIEGGRK